MKHLKCILKTEMAKGEVTCKKKASPKRKGRGSPKKGSPKKSPKRKLRRGRPLADSPQSAAEEVEDTLVDSPAAAEVAETMEYVV